MPTALFISPHLDDVAFSCGGALVTLARRGWCTVLATPFTASVPDPRGFALQCQTDKGIPPHVDYMRLRREEDRRFAVTAGVSELVWGDLPEAPHRGYESAPELFSGTKASDDIASRLEVFFAEMMKRHRPDLIFLPQGIGGHVDHLEVIAAARRVPSLYPRSVWWYQDTPYVIRHPDSQGIVTTQELAEFELDITAALDCKLDGAAEYTSQLGFQFGSPDQMRSQLTNYARSKSSSAGAVEVFLQLNQSLYWPAGLTETH